MAAANVRIEAWGPRDFPLLEQLLGDPAMTEHIGGPETNEQLMERQARYEVLTDPAEGGTFKIVDEVTDEGVGWIGYWERTWRDGEIYETGWFVLPAFQGRGVASAGTLLAIDAARAQRRHRFIHAFPSVDNPASNAICRKLGFELIGATDLEYPAGNWLRCNDWRLDLFAEV
jgi:RimJ/RimL family protein N-acetyltransferase